VAACGLPGVIRRFFSSYSVLRQPVISIDHDLPIVNPAAIFLYKHCPPRRSRFFVSTSIEFENKQSISTYETSIDHFHGETNLV